MGLTEVRQRLNAMRMVMPERTESRSLLVSVMVSVKS